MNPSATLQFSSIDAAAKHILEKYPRELRLATPLGLGKPIRLLNAIYDEVERSPQRSLEIYTALSLVPPEPNSDIERRFLEPFLHRQFGRDTPLLKYAEAMRRSKLPDNIQVSEFYFQAGQYLHRPAAQESYMSVNYTHVARAIADRGIDVVLQLISRNPKNPKELSLSCNPDVTLDIVDECRSRGRTLEVYAVVHPSLPFTGGDAIVDESFFAGIVDDPAVNYELFALPKGSVNAADHRIGMFASQLIADDGTLQIGIGSLSDAVVYSTVLRHKNNSEFTRLTKKLNEDRPAIRAKLHADTFSKGIYGTSEMIMDGFMHLRRAGILKRFIFDQDDKKLRYLHGAFFLGSKEFYQWLRDMSDADLDGFSMTRVSKVNDLYDEHEYALRRQRKNARFFNTCMKVSLLGGVVSETLESGEVVSGVGGQYNFVSMSHELADSHSVLMLRSTRMSRGVRKSNIVFNQPNETIPRHLRDIIVTEYGIACLRGRTDSEVIQSLIEISDSDFQGELVRAAQRAGKLSHSYSVPAWARANTAEKVHKFHHEEAQHLPEFPFGSDFTPVELKLVKALGALRDATVAGKLMTLLKGLVANDQNHRDSLQRMDLSAASGIKNKLVRAAILGALERT
ncbi:acetyl-CoA hydrolase/transferase C-terminal domain-containing protein [soil metagenome]